MQRTGNKLIKPSEYALLRGLNKSTISRQIKTGAIPTHDGLIDPCEADRARQRNVSARRQRKSDQLYTLTDFDINDLLGAGMVTDAREVRRQLLDRILGRRNLIPEILARIGVKDSAFIHSADDIFAALVIEFAGDRDPYDWDGSDDLPLVDVDYAGLTVHYNLQFTPAVIAAADHMADAVYPAIEKILEEAK